MEYLESYSRIELGLRETTINNKRKVLASLQKFLGKRPLNAKTAREYFKELHRRNWQLSSIRTVIRIVKAFSRFLHERNYIEKNFGTSLKTPRVPKKVLNIIPAERAEQVILLGTEPSKFDNGTASEAKKHCRLGLRFILRTGLRISELLRLRDTDFNFEDGTYTVQLKGGEIRVALLPPDLITELKLAVGNGLMFPVTQFVMNKVLERGCAKLSIRPKLTNHDLRHNFSTTLLR